MSRYPDTTKAMVQRALSNASDPQINASLLNIMNAVTGDSDDPFPGQFVAAATQMGQLTALQEQAERYASTLPLDTASVTELLVRAESGNLAALSQIYHLAKYNAAHERTIRFRALVAELGLAGRVDMICRLD